jgi:Asp-tRNA(Asn)/Glu-tRNA(Gln) amidotransferase A subunit family amidase
LEDRWGLVDLCLRRIAEQDGEIRAWAAVCAQPNDCAGSLSGIPYGAKDIIETRGLPTEYGSALYRGRISTEDAFVIKALRQTGAVLLGKTHTTAFASFDPAPTRNPRVPGHTPGGSSSGSAAAVAAGMVPFAVGTQSLGSVLRPASFCGVCGFKPTFGLIPTDGVLPFAPSLDTVGLFTQTAADMAALWERSFGSRSNAKLRRAASFGAPIARTDGFSIDTLPFPDGWERLTAAARLINDYEGARTHAERYREFGDRLGARLAELIRRGLALPEEEYAAAREHVACMRTEVALLFDKYDVILTPASVGPAPSGFESTGDPSANAPWTALGVPAISVPQPGAGPPIGLQMTAPWGADDALVAMAAAVTSTLSATF